MPMNLSARDAAGLAKAVSRESDALFAPISVTAVARGAQSSARAPAVASSLTIVPLQASMAHDVQHMTFPAYRHLLSLEENVRHPDDGDTRRVQPLGVVALHGDRPIGLALAEVLPIPPLPPSPEEGGLSDLVGPKAPLPGDHDASGGAGGSAGTSGVVGTSGIVGADGVVHASRTGDASPAIAALLSLYVDTSMRGRGVGTALVAALEDALRASQPVRLEAVYMTGKTNVAAIERVFAKRGWQPPAMRTYTLRFTTEDAERMPWFDRVPLRDRDFEMFAWGELGQAERDALIASQIERPWIPEGLEFWRHDHAGFDPVSSLGLRYRGAVVGWTINHRIATDTTRISGAFVRDDLSRRGRLMALWTESITRMKCDGVRWITSITPHQLAPMVAFLARRCAPWATFCGETRGTHIDLPLR